MKDPVFMKCCFGIPLKVCLYTWIGIKMTANLAASLFIIYSILWIWNFQHDGTFFQGFNIEHGLLLINIILLVDFILMVIMCAGLVKNSVVKVRMYYYYNIAMTILLDCFLVFMFFDVVIGMPGPELLMKIMYPICAIIYMVVDGFMLVTMKSEITKLRISTKFKHLKRPLSYPEPRPLPTLAEDTEQKTELV